MAQVRSAKELGCILAPTCAASAYSFEYAFAHNMSYGVQKLYFDLLGSFPVSYSWQALSRVINIGIK